MRWNCSGRECTTRGLVNRRAHLNEYLEALSDKLLAANISHLPVVSRTDAKLVGYIGWKDLMRVRSKQQAAERERSALLSFSPADRKPKAALE